MAKAKTYGRRAPMIEVKGFYSKTASAPVATGAARGKKRTIAEVEAEDGNGSGSENEAGDEVPDFRDRSKEEQIQTDRARGEEKKYGMAARREKVARLREMMRKRDGDGDEDEDVDVVPETTAMVRVQDMRKEKEKEKEGTTEKKSLIIKLRLNLRPQPAIPPKPKEQISKPSTKRQKTATPPKPKEQISEPSIKRPRRAIPPKPKEQISNPPITRSKTVTPPKMQISNPPFNHHNTPSTYKSPYLAKDASSQPKQIPNPPFNHHNPPPSVYHSPYLNQDLVGENQPQKPRSVIKLRLRNPGSRKAEVPEELKLSRPLRPQARFIKGSRTDRVVFTRPVHDVEATRKIRGEFWGVGFFDGSSAAGHE